MEQLRQQQLELAKAPVVEAPPAISGAPAEGTPAPAPAPAVQAEDAALAPSQPEGTTPPAAEGEGGELTVAAGTGAREAQVPETRTTTDEVAPEGQPVTLSVQDATQDSEESRKRRESMRNNAEQVC